MTSIATVTKEYGAQPHGHLIRPHLVSIYHINVVLLQPRGQLGAGGKHLEQRGSEGAVVVAPHPPHAAEPLRHLLITLQKHRGTSLNHSCEKKLHETLLHQEPRTLTFLMRALLAVFPFHSRSL